MAPRSRMPSFSQQLCRLHSSVTVINTTILCCHDNDMQHYQVMCQVIIWPVGETCSPPPPYSRYTNDDTFHSIHGSSQAPAVAL